MSDRLDNPYAISSRGVATQVVGKQDPGPGVVITDTQMKALYEIRQKPRSVWDYGSTTIHRLRDLRLIETRDGMAYPAGMEPERHANPIDEPEAAAAGDMPSAASHPEAPRVAERWILPEALPGLERNVRDLQRRAQRLGVPPLTLTIGGREIRTKKVPVLDERDRQMRDAQGNLLYRDVPYELVQITVAGESPRVPGGWHFVGTIDHEGDLNVIRAVPGESISPIYRKRAAICDHCRTERRRRETFVVADAVGKQTQVGRSCLVDFTGHKSAEQLADLAAAYADLFTELDEDDEEPGDGGGGGQRSYVNTVEFMAFVVALIKEFGYRGRKFAELYEKPTTGGAALTLAIPGLGQKYHPPPEWARDKAREIIAWAAAIPDDTPDEYLYNVHAVLQKGALTWRDTGIAASAAAAYDRALGFERERALARSVSKHFGKVGERERVKVLVVHVVTLEGDYGVSFFHILKTVPEGNAATWKTGTKLDVGKEYDFVCKIDSHGEYQGAAQTKLSRCSPYLSDEEKKSIKIADTFIREAEMLQRMIGQEVSVVQQLSPHEATEQNRVEQRKQVEAGLFETYQAKAWDESMEDRYRLSPKGNARTRRLLLEIADRGRMRAAMDQHRMDIAPAMDELLQEGLLESGGAEREKPVLITEKGKAELDRLRAIDKPAVKAKAPRKAKAA